MSTTVINKRLISTEEYRQMAEIGLLKPNERIELIHGEILVMSPIGRKHGGMVVNLTHILVPAFLNEFLISVQNSIPIDAWNEPQPDFVILRYKDDRYTTALPTPDDIMTVIEVSDTTYDFDHKIKMSLYASSGIPLYWIVNLTENRIEVYSDPRSDQYERHNIYYPGDEMVLLSGKIKVSDILISSPQ